MIKLAGLLGALIGLTVSVVFTEVIFPNDQEWPIAVNAGLTVVGVLVGSSLARRYTSRRETSA